MCDQRAKSRMAYRESERNAAERSRSVGRSSRTGRRRAAVSRDWLMAKTMNRGNAALGSFFIYLFFSFVFSVQVVRVRVWITNIDGGQSNERVRRTA